MFISTTRFEQIDLSYTSMPYATMRLLVQGFHFNSNLQSHVSVTALRYVWAGVKKIIFRPTTLLAIVDATVGGKNGVNWGGAKNLLGVVNHPDTI